MYVSFLLLSYVTLLNDKLADHRFEGYGYSVIGRATDATYGRNRRKDVFHIG